MQTPAQSTLRMPKKFKKKSYPTSFISTRILSLTSFDWFFKAWHGVTVAVWSSVCLGQRFWWLSPRFWHIDEPNFNLAKKINLKNVWNCGKICIRGRRILNKLTSDTSDLHPTGKWSILPPRPALTVGLLHITCQTPIVIARWSLSGRHQHGWLGVIILLRLRCRKKYFFLVFSERKLALRF